MRRLLLLIGALSLAAGAAQAQSGFDRPGGDYSNFQIRSGDPAICATRCEREAKCLAWTFSYPGPRSSAVCWLKEQVTARVKSDCCVSGVRGAAVTAAAHDQAVEYSIDRSGGDYRNFPIKAEGGDEACRKACEDDGTCRAWTYLRPGYLGTVPRCFLKSEIKRPRSKPCCLSGVVR